MTATRSAAFNVLVVVAFFGHAAAAGLYAWWDASDAVRGAVYFGSKIVVNAIPLVCVFGLQQRRWNLRRPSKQAVALGFASGVFIAGVILLAHRLTPPNLLRADALLERAGAYGIVDHFFLFAPFICLVNSGLEEYYWRWFMFAALRRRMRTGFAVVLSAVGFTLHHVVVLTAYFSDVGLIVLLNAGVFAGGVLWALLYDRCRSFYGPWISHVLADVAVMFVAYEILFAA